MRRSSADQHYVHQSSAVCIERSSHLEVRAPVRYLSCRMSAVLQRTGAKSASEQGTRFTWRDFAQRTWVHLAVAGAMFALGVGIAAHLFVMVGRW